ncbi:glycosyltransferase [Truepera radiovictrix]|uniref:Glycosyl transferase family 2 n=1 Tax=Truepera radiovictrix (strain DSM 17093 / CIP 108686 / LMG 22925 / RQ-24) TaxID=649638 RepID=D7CSC4_TRURR|nr:glycosyltransferase [Truepera radiovictrix]ADI13656.1 glycosyl transferase family 2 [Truepera radiovictrix DSM 17093]WMT57782.1 glycosyltransferase [Truepera radiovictrix]
MLPPYPNQPTASSSQPTLSVVIAAFTDARWPQLLAAVASVAAQRTPAELVVVVDHNDALLARARAALPAHYAAHATREGAPGALVIIPNTRARGLSGARNSGVAAATGEIIAFLDDDAVAEPDWLTHLTAPYGDPQVLGVGGAVLPAWPGAAPNWFPEEFGWVVGCSYRGGPRARAEVRNFIGCNMSFRRSALAAVGEFRVGLGRLGALPEGGEETELCIRLRQRFPEGRLLHVPEARVVHRIAARRLSLRYFAARCYAEGVSKARLTETVGRTDALEAERAYTRTALPRGVLRGLGAAFGGELAGFARAAAIALGLGLTALGYFVGLAKGYGRARGTPRAALPASAAAFEPVQLVDIDLKGGVPDLQPALSAAGRPYRRALALVRFAGRPLGLVKLEPGRAGVSARAFGEAIAAQLGVQTTSAKRVSQGLPGCAAGDKRWPFVSVVIATRERAQSLERCLASVAELEYPDFEVIVVDNNPATSATRELVAAFSAQRPALRLRYVREDFPGGAAAHNRGVLAARAEIIAFTDDDVVVDKGWLRALVAGFGAAERVGCVTGMILPAELETAPQGWLEQYGGFNKGFELRAFNLTDRRPPSPLYPYAAGIFGSGANMAFTREALFAFGGFDPALGPGSQGVGGEDLAAFFDVVTHGYTLVYQPAALLWHYHRRDYEGLRRQIYGYGVGFTAFLTKTVVERPARVFALLPLGWWALTHLLSPTSPKNANKRADYPPELSRLELRGLLYGPLAYLRSRWRLRGVRGRGRLVREAPHPSLPAERLAA